MDAGGIGHRPLLRWGCHSLGSAEHLISQPLTREADGFVARPQVEYHRVADMSCGLLSLADVDTFASDLTAARPRRFQADRGMLEC